MGGQVSIHKVTFEDIQSMIGGNGRVLLINTLSADEQACLIPTTIQWQKEEQLLNSYLKGRTRPDIIIYGKNCNDNSVYQKYMQLTALGFSSIRVYPGGMFEWLCLQDIYGEEEFPTTERELDLLRYKPSPTCNMLMIQDGRP